MKTCEVCGQDIKDDVGGFLGSCCLKEYVELVRLAHQKLLKRQQDLTERELKEGFDNFGD